MKKSFALLLLGVLPVSAFAEDLLFSTQNHIGSLYYLVFLVVALLLFYLGKLTYLPKMEKEPGFRVITVNHVPKFFPLAETTENMEPVVTALADKNTNVYSNLAKITITHKTNRFLVEDKNFKNSILINRRRSRRSFLHHDDVLDMGELTLIYVDPFNQEPRTETEKSKFFRRNSKVTGKVLDNCATLIPADSRSKTFFLTKNLTFIGRSDTNDLITKNKMVSLKHAKIERVAGKHKLVDMSSLSGTFVNGRRIEERYLKEGDELTFESVRYRYSAQGKAR